MAKRVEHYVDNAKFLEALTAYKKGYDKAKKAKRKKDPPPVPEYIGECFLKIATHLSYKPNFVNYTFRDDMISDGVENCLVYVHNFDPAKSNNPFGYFTQIIYYAFLRRIQREKKYTYTKYKVMEQQLIDGEIEGSPDTARNTLNFDNVQDFINRYDNYTSSRREKRRQAKAAHT